MKICVIRNFVPIFVHVSFIEILDQPEFHLCHGARFPEISAGLFVPDIGTPDHLKLFRLVWEKVKGGRTPLQNGALILSLIDSLSRQLHIMGGEEPILIAPRLSHDSQLTVPDGVSLGPVLENPSPKFLIFRVLRFLWIAWDLLQRLPAIVLAGARQGIRQRTL